MPMRSAIVAVIVDFLLNLTLIWFMGQAGLAASTALCSYLQVVILIIGLRRKLGRSVLDGLRVTLFKTSIATLIMGLVGILVIFLTKELPERRLFDAVRLAVIVPASAAVYIYSAKFLRIEMLSLLTGRKA